MGPIPWTLSLQPSSLVGLSRNAIFGMKDLSWVPECLSLKGVCSPCRFTAFGKTILSFAVVLRVTTFLWDGSAHLYVARVLLVQGKGLVPPAHCLVNPFGAAHESQSGARGPNALLPSASAS